MGLAIKSTAKTACVTIKPAKHCSITIGDLSLTASESASSLGVTGWRRTLPASDPGIQVGLLEIRCVALVPRTWSTSSQTVRHSQCTANGYSTLPRLASQPCVASNPQPFADVILGTCWIEDRDIQSFCILFLSSLKEARALLLTYLISFLVL